MVKTEAVVKQRIGSHALVEVKPNLCPRCENQGGCQANSFSQLFCTKPQLFEVKNPIDAQVGERVTVAINRDQLVKNGILGYGIPLMGFVIGAGIGQLYWNSNSISIIGSVIGILLALFYVKIQSKNHKAVIPEIISVEV